VNTQNTDAIANFQTRLSDLETKLQTFTLQDNPISKPNALSLPDDSINFAPESTLSNTLNMTTVTTLKITIPIGFYETISTILDAMMKKINETLRSQLPRETDFIFFDYKLHNRRISVTLPPKYAITWSTTKNKSYLGTMLGFTNNDITSSCISSFEPSLLAGKDMLFIYCSIIKPQIVGNQNSQLIGVVPVNVARNTYIQLRYDSPNYLPINLDLLDFIKIEIRDATAELVKFEAGKVMVRLHFTKNK
jgi:hypothetical protein